MEVANLARKELLALRKRCTTTKFDRKTRQPIEDLDEEKFVDEFTKATLKNWKGLTIAHLETLILIDAEGQDPTQEVGFSDENAQLLVSNSSEFDGWLNEVVFDLENFRSEPKRVVPEATGGNVSKS